MREVNYKPPSSSSVFRLGLGILAGLVVAYMLFTSWYQVDQGERAVVLRFGEIVGESGPGLHFKLPWVDTVSMITVQNQTKRYSSLEAYSRDQQPATRDRVADRLPRALRTSSRIRAPSIRNTAISRVPSCGSSTRA